MHSAVNIMMVQSRIDDMHRAGAASRLAGQARRGAAGTSHTAQRSERHSMTQPSLFRRVAARLAF